MTSFNDLYVGYIVPASTLLPIIAGIIDYKRLTKPLRVLLGYLSIALLINCIGIIMANYGKNNLPLLHAYTIFELLAAMLYYKYAFSSMKMDYWIRIIIIAFPVLCIINFSFIQSIFTFNTYTRPLEAIIIIVFSGIYLAEQNNFERKDLITSSGRWVASAFLVYFCSSLFQFIFSNVVSQHATRDVKRMIWNIHATFVLIMYIFFYIAIRSERSKR